MLRRSKSSGAEVAAIQPQSCNNCTHEHKASYLTTCLESIKLTLILVLSEVHSHQTSSSRCGAGDAAVHSYPLGDDPLLDSIYKLISDLKVTTLKALSQPRAEPDPHAGGAAEEIEALRAENERLTSQRHQLRILADKQNTLLDRLLQSERIGIPATLMASPPYELREERDLLQKLERSAQILETLMEKASSLPEFRSPVTPRRTRKLLDSLPETPE